MNAVIWLIDTIVSIYIWILIAQVILSWLVAFNIVNTRQPIVYQVGSFLHRITEPVLGPVRRLLPNLGGIDISPVLVIIGLIFLKRLVIEALIGIAYG